jgi:hypothetical protein
VRIFGGVIPFIGFRTEWVARSLAVEWGVEEAPYRMTDDFVLVDKFDVEWLGAGMTICVRGSKRATDAKS